MFFLRALGLVQSNEPKSEAPRVTHTEENEALLYAQQYFAQVRTETPEGKNTKTLIEEVIAGIVDYITAQVQAFDKGNDYDCEFEFERELENLRARLRQKLECEIATLVEAGCTPRQLRDFAEKLVGKISNVDGDIIRDILTTVINKVGKLYVEYETSGDLVEAKVQAINTILDSELGKARKVNPEDKSKIEGILNTVYFGVLIMIQDCFKELEEFGAKRKTVACFAQAILDKFFKLLDKQEYSTPDRDIARAIFNQAFSVACNNYRISAEG